MGVSVELNEVERHYGTVQALSEITVRLEPGTFTTLVGPSGCGKSTMLDIIAGLNREHGGAVRVGDAPLDGPRRETGIIFQEAALLPWRDIVDNAAFALEAQGVPKARRRERAREVIDRVGLTEFASHYPHQLSGGMKQRTAIARVLATEPDLILADEPFGALDEQTRMTLGLELLRVVRQTRATVFFITHSIQEAVLLSDRILLMSARPGRILLDETVDLPDERQPSHLGSDTTAHLQEKMWTFLSAEASQALSGTGRGR